MKRRLKTLIAAFTLVVLAAVAALEIADLWWQRSRTLDAGRQRASHVDYIVSEYVRESFMLADASLRQLVIHGQRVGGATAPAAEWDPILAAAKASLPGSGSITVTNSTGRIVHSTQPAIVNQSRKDNYIYRELAAGREDLVVDRPFQAVTLPTKQFIIPIGRRLTNDNDTFGGMVVATILPSAYRDFLRTVDVGERGTIWVFHPDGVVLFREPSTGDPMNESASGNPILADALKTRGAGLIEGPVDKGDALFISAYRTLDTPPLVVSVSLSEDELLEDWRAHVRSSAAAFGALSLTLGVIVALLFRQVDARSRAEHELGEVQRAEADHLRIANERLEQALEREQQARHDAEAASYLKDEFLMTVSHELRTPLTAIYGWVRMLSTKEIPPEQQARALAAVERNAAAQTKLIDDLLDVSRAISGKLRLDARPVNPAEVVHAAVETLGPALEAKSIHFEQSVDPRGGTILADPDRLQQIVWNLLSNAIKFTPDGGTVRLRLARADSQIEIVVSDSGAGIEPAFLPHVFERFRQAEAGTRRRYGGLGLGLAIVRHLAELHGGTVSAQSDGLGRGATFRVVLPARMPAARTDPDQPVASALQSQPSPARLDGISVLVVDDDADARELFESMLANAGATVWVAASAREALRALAARNVDVLLSDIEMPGEDGYALLQQAQAMKGASGLIAIAITAYARAADRRRALEAGFHWHIAKPVEPADAVSVIASLLSARSA